MLFCYQTITFSLPCNSKTLRFVLLSVARDAVVQYDILQCIYRDSSVFIIEVTTKITTCCSFWFSAMCLVKDRQFSFGFLKWPVLLLALLINFSNNSEKVIITRNSKLQSFITLGITEFLVYLMLQEKCGKCVRVLKRFSHW